MLKALNKTTKQCPKCGFSCDYKADLISINFGWRIVAGREIPQSYCLACRSNKTEARKDVVSHALNVRIPGDIKIDLIGAREIYSKEYPGDKNGPKRSFNFIAGKLQKRGYKLQLQEVE